MHRNTFLSAPKLLTSTLQFRDQPHWLAAGHLVGTEGYTAAVTGGWLVGMNAVRLAQNLAPVTLPETTMSGALIHYISTADVKHFQPRPPNFGIMLPLEKRIRSRQNAMGSIEIGC